MNIMLNPEVLNGEVNEINTLKNEATALINDTLKAINELTQQGGGLASPEGAKLAGTYGQKATKMMTDLEEFVNEYVTALNNAANNLINASSTNAGNIQA